MTRVNDFMHVTTPAHRHEFLCLHSTENKKAASIHHEITASDRFGCLFFKVYHGEYFTSHIQKRY